MGIFGRSSSSGGSSNNSNNGKKKNEAEHTSGKRKSTQQQHEEGQTRKAKDQGGRKAHLSGRTKPNPNTRNGRAAAQNNKKKGQGRG